MKNKETLEEFAERLCPNKQVEYDMILEGAKWQQERSYNEKQMDDAYDKGFKDATERSYSEEEVLDMLVEFSSEINNIHNITEWFEIHKKK